MSLDTQPRNSVSRLPVLAAIAVLAAAIGCDGASGRCSFDESYAATVGHDTSMDCGSATLDRPASYTAAHDCVVASLAAGAAFHVTWYSQGIDSTIRAAYIGTTAGVLRLSYDSDPSGGDDIGAALWRSMCATFADRGACGSLEGDLCFSCTSTDEGERLCN